jgi:hypothetical protein
LGGSSRAAVASVTADAGTGYRAGHPRRKGQNGSGTAGRRDKRRFFSSVPDRGLRACGRQKAAHGQDKERRDLQGPAKKSTSRSHDPFSLAIASERMRTHVVRQTAGDSLLLPHPYFYFEMRSATMTRATGSPGCCITLL